MQVENDYNKKVYNGDLGVVSRIDMEEARTRGSLRTA
jgi:ATP-dependent exoDNAse (exonuclease V) alpha subunit